jgi:TRAP-type C4-dicarboxylate transport system permease small subunit
MLAARLLIKASDLANRGVEWLLAGLGMSMALVIGAQVFFRYVLNDSLFWSEELGRLILVWLTFLGASAAYKRGGHIGVDVVVQAFPVLRKPAALLSILASLFLFGIMAWYGWKFLDFVKFQWTTSLGVTKRVPFIMVPVGGALMFLHALALLVRELGLAPPEDDGGASPTQGPQAIMRGDES